MKLTLHDWVLDELCKNLSGEIISPMFKCHIGNIVLLTETVYPCQKYLPKKFIVSSFPIKIKRGKSFIYFVTNEKLPLKSKKQGLIDFRGEIYTKGLAVCNSDNKIIVSTDFLPICINKSSTLTIVLKGFKI